MTLKDINVFLEKMKTHIGFGNYDIILIKHDEIETNKIAQATPDEFDKTLKIELYGDFFDDPNKKQELNIIHELVHARVSNKESAVESNISIVKFREEEKMVNDIAMLVQKYGDYRVKKK